ncbi:MAG: helix-turn-helix transcriptional regulator [Nitrosomonas ureae]
MRDPLILLRLTADLHACAREPSRLPQAWAALCQWFDCPDVFGAQQRSDAATDAWPERLAAVCDTARHCAQTASRPCAKRQACLGTLDHLALATRRPASPEPSLAVLDALPVPMLLCRADRRLVFANHAAQREIEYQRWLRFCGDQFSATDPIHEARLAAAFDQLAGGAPEHAEIWLPGPPSNGETADFVLRRLAGEALFLLSVIVHVTASSAEQLERLGELLRLPPRQRELAGHLLGGLSLDLAAARMGIGRRTARDHLKGLFHATGTSRQTELIANLSRAILG